MGPHLSLALSGVMKERSWDEGIRAAMFCGVFSAGRPVDVIILMSGKDDGGCEEMMKRVPFDM